MDPIAIGKKIKEAYPQYAKVDDAVIGNKYLTKFGGAVSGVTSGQIKISDIPEAQRVGVSLGLSGAGYKPPEKAADTKNTDAARSVLGFINSLESKFSEAGGGTFGVGPGARIKGSMESLKGAAGLNEPAAVYNDSKEGFAATLKTLTGDTGVLTDQDFARLSKLLPGLGSTNKESTDKFNQLRDQISSKYGVGKQETTFKPKIENKRGALASILDIPFGGAVNLEEKAQKDFTNQLKTGQYKNISDLLFPKTKEDVGLLQDVAPAGIEAGANLVAAQGAISGAKNVLGNILGGGAKTAAAREVAAKAITKPISVDPLVKAGEEYVKRDPTAARLWGDVLKPALAGQKEVSVPDLLKQIQVWGDAYTSAGKVGKTALAGLNDALYKAGRNVIKTEAPEVAKLTADMARRFAIQKTLGRFGPAAVGAAGGITGAAIVGKALGQQRR